MIRAEHQAVGMAKLPLLQILPICIEDLNAGIVSIANIDQIAVDHDGVRQVELSRTVALHSPAEQRVAILIELHHPRIAVTIRDVYVSFAVPRDISRLIEMQDVIPWNPHSAQCEQLFAIGAEF